MYKNNAALYSSVQKNIERINPMTLKTKNDGTMKLSKCVVCGTKKSRFIKKQKAKELLTTTCIRTPLSKIPILGDISNAIPMSIKRMT